MKKLAFIFLALNFSCHASFADPIFAKRSHMGKERERFLGVQCSEMNNHGSILDLLTEMKENWEILKAARSLEDIKKIQVRIKANLDRIAAILSSEWTGDSWYYETDWFLDSQDIVDDMNRYLTRTFKIKSFEVESVYLAGIERKDLIQKITAAPHLHSLKVSLKKTASVLELCQFQHTLQIKGRAVYRFVHLEQTQPITLLVKPGVNYDPEDIKKALHSDLVIKPRYDDPNHGLLTEWQQ